MRILLASILIVLSGGAFAISYTHVTKVQSYTIGGSSTVRVKLENRIQHSGEELCGASSASEIQFYSLDTSTADGDKLFAVLLSAHATKASLFLQLNGCIENRPNISHIYICDTLWCN